MRTRLSSSHGDEMGFTLVELAVGVAVGVVLLSMTVSFLMYSVGVAHKLNVVRDIRDQGIVAVETIEREFRKVLEYGGSYQMDSDALTASFGGRVVSIAKDGSDNIVLVSGGDTTVFDGAGKCTSFGVTALLDNGQARVILIEFELEDGSYGIKRSFKAAFSSVNATGS